jgi:GNAT superfamily N-acetyltransferase
VIGYIQFSRESTSPSVQQQIAALLAWYYQLQFRVARYYWPNRAQDPVAIRRFKAASAVDNALYWSSVLPSVADRWQVQSLVVAKEWQGKGIGRRLMNEAMDKARSDGVTLGLISSEEGEGMYRKLGFRFLGRLSDDLVNAKADKGGIMVWEPEGVQYYS